jgi:hypothetical protein
MSEQIDQISPPVSREGRKQLLALSCARDRLAWVNACRPATPRSPLAQIATEAANYIEPFSHFLPRRIGKWIRRATFLTSLGRRLGWMGRG